MTLDEINRRKSRAADAYQKLNKAQKALNDARDEYAEQEANKAGIVYGETKVMALNRGPFFVLKGENFWTSRPFYALANVKKDGSMSKCSSGLSARLDQMTIITDESETP